MKLIETYVGDRLDLACEARRRQGSDVRLDITTADITFYARGKLDGEYVTFEKTIGDGIEITDGPEGEFLVSILPADTNILGDEGGRLAYFLRIQFDPDTRYTVSAGDLILKQALLP